MQFGGYYKLVSCSTLLMDFVRSVLRLAPCVRRHWFLTAAMYTQIFAFSVRATFAHVNTLKKYFHVLTNVFWSVHL